MRRNTVSLVSLTFFRAGGKLNRERAGMMKFWRISGKRNPLSLDVDFTPKADFALVDTE